MVGSRLKVAVGCRWWHRAIGECMQVARRRVMVGLRWQLVAPCCLGNATADC